jgi:hypothetical protein
VVQEGLIGLFFNTESGAGGMADNPDHPDRVLFKFFIRIADGPDDLFLKIRYPVDIVNNREIRNIVEEAIDRDVTAQGILLRGPKAVSLENLPVIGERLFKFGMAPESGDLNHLSPFKEDMDQPEPSAYDPAVFKKGMDLMGVSVGGDIKILWDLSEEKIPDASTDEAG